MRILVVEDDPDLARQLKQALGDAGYAVDHAPDGEEGQYLGENEPYDAVVLDLGLPKIDGVSVLEQWRRANITTPVLILTARGAWSEKVAGFDAGADDYLTKPFHFGELLARVRAMTRRRLPLLPERLDCGRLVLNTRTQEARVDDRLVELTAREYALLEYLCRQKGGVVSREEMAERVWDGRYDPCSNVIDVYVQRLRRKLDTGKDSFIRTRRGAGYQLVAEGDS
jgi:two-component system OmpR family response regulator